MYWVLISLVFIIIIAIPFIIRDMRRDGEELSFLKETGFNCSSYIYASDPFVGFDHDKKIMAIVKKDKSISLYTAKDIMDYRWDWLERNGLRLNNTITITLKDIKNPILKINLRNNSSGAEVLMGKISNL